MSLPSTTKPLSADDSTNFKILSTIALISICCASSELLVFNSFVYKSFSKYVCLSILISKGSYEIISKFSNPKLFVSKKYLVITL